MNGAVHIKESRERLAGRSAVKKKGEGANPDQLF